MQAALLGGATAGVALGVVSMWRGARGGEDGEPTSDSGSERDRGGAAAAAAGDGAPQPSTSAPSAAGSSGPWWRRRPRLPAAAAAAAGLALAAAAGALGLAHHRGRHGRRRAAKRGCAALPLYLPCCLQHVRVQQIRCCVQARLLLSRSAANPMCKHTAGSRGASRCKTWCASRSGSGLWRK